MEKDMKNTIVELYLGISVSGNYTVRQLTATYHEILGVDAWSFIGRAGWSVRVPWIVGKNLRSFYRISSLIPSTYIRLLEHQEKCW